MFRLPPLAKRVFLNLTAMTVAALVTAISACSSNDTNPTAQPALAERVNQLSTEVASLREPTDALAATGAPRATPPPAATHQSAQTMMPQATRPIATPAQVVTPTPTGSGICGRSPAVQETILHTLRTTSCRLVSVEELYRITKFRDLRGDFYQPQWTKLQAGDLDGLVNLEELNIRGDFDLPPNTFAGAGIKLLTLSGVALSPDAFEGMIFLDSLHMQNMKDFPTLNAEVFTGLRELFINFNEPLPDLTGDELKQLTNLRQVGIAGYLYEGMPSYRLLSLSRENVRLVAQGKCPTVLS